MAANLAMQHILITGASSGIGAALARAYAAPNVLLSLTGRDLGRLNAVADECRTHGAEIRLYTQDFTDYTALGHWLSDSFDTQPIDLVIANAGISGGSGDLSQHDSWPESMAQINAIFTVNLMGVLHTITPLLAKMRARGRGRGRGHIAVMSSMAGFFGMPSAPSYSTSKAAIRLYADALRPLVAPYGIDMSVICPGFVRTPLTDINRFPMPFLMTADRAASLIIDGLHKRKKMIAFPFVLYMFIALIAMLPSRLRDFILTQLPGKEKI